MDFHKALGDYYVTIYLGDCAYSESRHLCNPESDYNTLLTKTFKKHGIGLCDANGIDKDSILSAMF